MNQAFSSNLSILILSRDVSPSRIRRVYSKCLIPLLVKTAKTINNTSIPTPIYNWAMAGESAVAANITNITSTPKLIKNLESADIFTGAPCTTPEYLKIIDDCQVVVPSVAALFIISIIKYLFDKPG